MTAATSRPRRQTPAARVPPRCCGRDLFVTWRELPVFLAQVILQPLFLLFVFGKVLGSLGYTQHRLRGPAVPGPARADRGDHRHADAGVPARGRVRLDEGDRGPPARADVDRRWWRPRRSCSRRCARSSRPTVMIPVGILVLGSIPWRWSGVPLLVLALVLGSLLGAGLGLVLGTLVVPQRINIVFSLVFTPLLFTGCSQYPWPSLDRLRWFQVVTAVQPDDLRQRVDARGARPERPAHRALGLPASCSSARSPCCSRSACAASTGARSTSSDRGRFVCPVRGTRTSVDPVKRSSEPAQAPCKFCRLLGSKDIRAVL